MIRALDPQGDRAAVAALLTRAQDYYQLWKGQAPGPAEVEEVFTSTPPGCDPDLSHRLGLFVDGILEGVAELSFGFPEPDDAYLGLMLLAPTARSKGHGATFFAQIEIRARTAGASRICLAVLQANPRAATFWTRMGFQATGITRHDTDTGHTLHRLGKPL